MVFCTEKLNWSKEEYWESTAGEVNACYFEWAIISGIIKTEQQKEQEHIELKKKTFESLKSMMGA